MKKYFPVNIDLNGKSVVIAGGGKVALRKAKTLLEYGASISVITGEKIEPELEKMALEMKIKITQRNIKPGDLKKAFMVVAATDDHVTNEYIAKKCIAGGIIINNASGEGDAIFPAVYKEGDLTVSVSTSGVSPTLALRLRNLIGKLFGGRYSQILNLMKEYRLKAQNEITDESKRVLFFKELNDAVFPEKDLPPKEFEKQALELFKKYAK